MRWQQSIHLGIEERELQVEQSERKQAVPAFRGHAEFWG